MWIELHDTLPDHDKVLQVSETLKMDKDLVVGKLVRLWCWALSNREDGRFKNRDTETIAEIMRFKGKPQKLIDALEAAKLLDKTDEGYEIHDWREHVSALLERREINRSQARARKQKQRERDREDDSIDSDCHAECHANVTYDCHACHAVTVPNHNSMYTNVYVSPPISPPQKNQNGKELEADHAQALRDQAAEEAAELEEQLAFFHPDVRNAIRQWLSYKAEKHQAYRPTGLKTFLAEALKQSRKLGAKVVAESILLSMAANYTGVVWDKAVQLDHKTHHSSPTPNACKPSRGDAWTYDQRKYTEAELGGNFLPLDDDTKMSKLLQS